MYLVDTNVLSESIRARANGRVMDWLASQDEVAFSAVTLEELAFGVERAPAAKRQRLRHWLDGLLTAAPLVLPVDENVAVTAGRLRASREAAGRPVAQADMLIAATAALSGRVLVTRNVKDFAGCGIALLDPFEET
jgi:predicted nucleic acid-binding protein